VLRQPPQNALPALQQQLLHSGTYQPLMPLSGIDANTWVSEVVVAATIARHFEIRSLIKGTQ
jgi:hypothetical protein